MRNHSVWNSQTQQMDQVPFTQAEEDERDIEETEAQSDHVNERANENAQRLGRKNALTPGSGAVSRAEMEGVKDVIRSLVETEPLPDEVGEDTTES